MTKGDAAVTLMRLVLASNNVKKLAELQQLFSGLPIELVSQGSLGIVEAEEPHLTFIENGLAKARHAAAASGLPALADDSGLCVDALGGEPGVASAHYAQMPHDAPTPAAGDREAQRRAQDAANNQLLLQRLAAHSNRRAAFVSTLVAVRHAHDPQPLVACGRWQGAILLRPQGQGGFGYDPLMFIPALGASAAELDPAVKNRYSHRAMAAQRMRDLLREDWHLD